MVKTQKPLLVAIDFNKPWWHLLVAQKWSVILVMIEEILTNVFETLIPILIAAAFSRQRYDYFIYFAGSWLAMIVLQDIIRKINARVELRCIHSIHFNAHQRLLTVDPMYHAHKDSGAILSKIERCARSYETLIDAVIIDLFGYVAGIITAIISLMQESILLALLLCFLLLCISIINIKLAKIFIIPLELNLIRTDDTVKSISQENLSQINFIRSYFSSNEINKLLQQRDNDIIYQEQRLRNANITMWTSIKVMYLLTVFILGSYLLHAIYTNELTIITGISLMVMYIQGTYGIISLERPVRVALRSLTRIKDLYHFIPSFGKQTFPVLTQTTATPLPMQQRDPISLHVNDISFWYNHHIHIFDNHSLLLDIPQKQPLKLYGIIGPSGIGKSTLLGIIGGQLRPKKGTVIINDIDIYTVDDTIRRSLIALQGQTATSFRGTLKHNLLFGLPLEEQVYTDEYLISILARVGLWSMFKTKQGLASKVGESGLTLSGGQRQRLNFASLYLRANYYKPPLILIDEPTSSLDEVSEQAITAMMLELAHNALTIVIAHRLKTIQQALGILDFSLIHKHKYLTFYSQQELVNVSAYYQQLITGIVSLE